MQRPNLERQQLEQLADFDTALLANLLGYVDPTPAHLWYMGNEIQSLIPDVGPTVGVALTCHMDTSSPDDEVPGDMHGFHELVEEMESLKLPSVWMVACVGRRPRHECVVGDGMGKLLASVGCVGAVTDGGARDLVGLRSIGFGVYGTAVTIHHCRMRVLQTRAPVELGGIQVQHFDVIHAGAEGVIRIPHAAINTLIERAPEFRAFEHAAHQVLRRTDLSVARKRELVQEALEDYGFSPGSAQSGGSSSAGGSS